MLNLDQGELDKLKKLLNYPNDLAIEIAKVLPEAVLFSIHESERLSTALIPMVETIITRSVAQNPRLLADALYPVIGRSIRKSINEEFKKLLLTFNELIENTFSSSALKWRYQSVVTGRKYSEIVITNTIKYKAEHVFLIHKETGLLLCEVHDELTASADPDMISGMLKAITDFVHDSFENTANSELNLIEMQEYQVLIEQGPHAIIAALVKGFTLEEYREILLDTLEKIHDQYATSFTSFNGDTFIFDTSRDLLTKCLKTEKKEEFVSKKSRIGLVVALPILAIVLFFAGRSIYFRFQWNKYVDRLKQSELVLLSQHGKSHGAFYVHGMILPGATHPDSLLNDFDFPKDRFKSSWHFYLPGDQQMVQSFLTENFEIPKEITIEVEKNVVRLKGMATTVWLEKFTDFLNINLSWYTLDRKNLEVISLADLKSRIKTINQTFLYFNLGAVELTDQSKKDLLEMINELKILFIEADLISNKLAIHINGYADRIGDVQYNQILSSNRAGFVKDQLIQNGISEEILEVEGKGILEGPNQLTPDQRRRVNLVLTLTPKNHD